MFERLRPVFGHAVSLLTTVLIFAATSLVWSMTRAEGLSETVAFTLAAVGASLLPRLAQTGALQTFGWIVIAALPFIVRALPMSSSMPAVAGSDPLFSSDRGLLGLTPVAYIGLVGLLLSLRWRSHESPAPLLVVLAWFIAAYVTPAHGSDGRFAHGLTAALAVLAPGLATAIDRARQRPWLATAAVIVAAIGWNYWLMVQYTVGTIPKDAPVNFSDMVRQQADVHTRPPYVYPFALPANAWFAWREGLPIDRYELLASEPRRTELDLVLDRRATRFPPRRLGSVRRRGQRFAGLDPRTRGHAGRAARIAAGPTGRRVGHGARTPRGAAGQRHHRRGHQWPRNRPCHGAAVGASRSCASRRADVGSLWRAGYNRVTFVSHGVARLDPSDSRPPGPLARRLGDRAWPVAIHRLRIAVANAP